MKAPLQIMSTFLLIAVGIIAVMAFKTNDSPTVYHYKQFSTIESLVPGGMGRSRIVTTDEQGVSVEKDLLNFFSLVGINFSNVSNNDKMIVDKINEFSSQGWELYQVTTGVQSHSKDATGIFITRYLFRQVKK